MQAYMYGFFKNKRIVLYDTLIQQVSWNIVEIFYRIWAFTSWTYFLFRTIYVNILLLI